MKKITLLLSMALCSLAMNAQNAYTLTTTTGQTYTDIAGTSINGGQVWDWDYFGEFTMPINFTFHGQTVTRFVFEDDYFAFLTPTADYDSEEEFEPGVFVVYPTGIFIQDRTYSTDTSTSPITYTVEGTAPNRIMKLQVKNAGAEDALWFGYDEDEFYINLQVWLYESDKAIEIHHGPNNISAEFFQEFIDSDEWTGALLSNENTAYTAFGNPENATYGEFTDATFPDPGPSFTSYPANGTVYRFAPATTTGTTVFNTDAFSVYPNPASNVLNVRAQDDITAPYAIYNVLGTVVGQGSLTGTDTAINTANLQEGVYVIKIGTQNLKFIKK